MNFNHNSLKRSDIQLPASPQCILYPMQGPWSLNYYNYHCIWMSHRFRNFMGISRITPQWLMIYIYQNLNTNTKDGTIIACKEEWLGYLQKALPIIISSTEIIVSVTLFMTSDNYNAEWQNQLQVVLRRMEKQVIVQSNKW